ncbi:MAG: hypothetical protein GTO40_20545, partial [Deltaproteobacteria bacterium]|nr:hypothetical protein [Deltaproteobacteria bacterium]
MPSRLPCIVLAGSDPFSGAIPTGLKREDMLTGYKGAQRLPVKRCLAGELVERLKQSDRFEGPILVGPRRIYEGEVDCQVVNAEGDILTTLRTALQFVRARFNFSSPVAFSTCDILPTPNEIRQLLDFCYAPHEGSPFWWQMVEAEPASLGAGAWKRPYRIRPEVGEPPKNLYPGHLVIARPSALRIELANRVLELMYRYRNREVRKRHFPMIARGLGTLVR